MKKALAILYLLLTAAGLAAQSRQQPADSLVRLMSAQSAELIQERNRNYRKVIGPARFLHNKTYLICDTAYWDVDIHIIKAFGNVRILQDETVLSSEKLDYYIDDDLAQFRGTLVQLQDKDHNTLRTRFLDYNTKDSVAIFKHGGAMRDKDGQLIESTNGSYDSKTKIFRFDGDVNMFTDSVFVKTADLTYYSNESRAVFEYGVDIWKEANMLSARRGEYRREQEEFHFFDEVHGLTDKQEGWSDTLHFNKLTQDIDLHGNVQVTDDSRKLTGMGEHVWYVDSLDRLTMSVDATIIAEIEDENNKQKPKDTLYMAADRIVRTAIRRCDISEGTLTDSKKRLSDLEVDPVSAYRKKASDEAKKAADEREREMAEQQGRKPGGAGFQQNAASPEAGPDRPGSPKDTPPAAQKPGARQTPSGPAAAAQGPVDPGQADAAQGPADPGQAAADSLKAEPPKDTTKLSFIQAVGKVRVFKSDMQARCDSLLYSDLDSLALLYVDPIVWNEGNRQYVSDSITVVVQNSRMRKASLMSNAFITIQEDSVCFDQIRGTEMMAYFDTTTALQRFDALGGATAVFFLEENDALATVNRVESKMLSAYFKDGEIQRIYYFDKPHNDAYPTVQLPKDDRQMKGFRWDPDRRPNGMVDITPYVPRMSERLAYEARPQAKFNQTEKYFPGYMKEVYAGLAARDSAQRESRRMRDSLELDRPRMIPPQDTLQGPSLPDTLQQAGLDTTALALPKAATAEEKEETTEQAGPDLKEENPDGAGKAVPDTLAPPQPVLPEQTELSDSLKAVRAAQDSIRAVRAALRAAADSIRHIQEVKDSVSAAKKAVRDSIRQARLDKKEARWAILDARDAAKDSIKAVRKQVKYRQTVLKKLEIRDKEAAREQARLERYIRHYEKVKARREERLAKHPERQMRKLQAEEKKAAKRRAAAEKKAAKAAAKEAGQQQEAGQQADGKDQEPALKPKRIDKVRPGKD